MDNHRKRAIDPQRERFLLVDDNPYILKVLQEAISSWGYPVDTCSEPEQGLKKLKNGLYTFLVADLRMPRIDGFELIREARRLRPEILCIAVTGYAQDYGYMSAVQAGATDFLRKPFELEELQAKILRAVIERDRALELLTLSITDTLTGLFNRRHFYKVLEQEITRAARQKYPLSLVLLDLDVFKAFNDRYGHIAGDRLLERVGGVIRSRIRDGVDSAYRYGGDEFAVILVDADAPIAERIGMRIRSGVQEECNISVTLGHAVLADGMNPEALIALADSRLYQAKGVALNGDGVAP